VWWQQYLLEFNLRINYLSGNSNQFADGLSRDWLRVVAALVPYDYWLSRITAAVAASPEASGLKRKALNADSKSNNDTYVVLHGVLIWRSLAYCVYKFQALLALIRCVSFASLAACRCSARALR
jgi:hypothetical protein